MSQDVNHPGQSDRNNSVELQLKSSSIGQHVIVLTPGMLKDLGLSDNVKLLQSKSSADCNKGAISPIKIDSKVQKIILQKVLKPADAQKSPNNSNSNTNKKKSSVELEKAVSKNTKNNSSIRHWITSKSKIVNEHVQDNVKDNNISKTHDAVHKIPTATQSSATSNSISQMSEKKYNYKKSVVTVLPEGINKSQIIRSPNVKTYARKTSLPVTLPKKSTDIKQITDSNKTLCSVTNSPNANNKLLLTKISSITSPKISTESTKLITYLNKIPSKVTNPSIDNSFNRNNKQETKSEKLNHTQTKNATVLLKKYVNSPEPSLLSSLSLTKKSLAEKSHDINEHHIFKNTTNKNFLSTNVVKNDDIIAKNTSSVSKRKSIVKTLSEQKPQTIKTPERNSGLKFTHKIAATVVSEPRKKFIEDRNNMTSCDVEKSGTKISPKKQRNICNNDKNNSSKETSIVYSDVEILEEITVEEKKSDIIKLSDSLHGRGEKIRQHAELSSKNVFKKPNAIDNEKISKNITIICESQSTSLVTNGISSSKSAKIEKYNTLNSKANQSKIINGNLKKTHDKIENNNEKINVPDTTNTSEIPNTSAVLEISTVNKGRGRPRKSLIVNDVSKSNLTIEKSNNGSLIIDKKNEVEDQSTPELGRTRSSRIRRGSWKIKENNEIHNDSMTPAHVRSRKATIKKTEMTKSQSDDEERSSDDFKNDDCEKELTTYQRKQPGCRGRKRGKPPTLTVDSDYMPRTLEVKHKGKKNDSKKNINKLNTEEAKKIDVTCGKCSEKMSKKQWIAHNLNKHNNMGWREGDEVPDFESNEKLWRRVLLIAHKRKKGGLLCEKCCTIKRSVVGFISHYQFCGKSDAEREGMKWVCPECHGVFMPSSQDVHERMHRDAERNKVKLLEQMSENNSSMDDGKRKRKAAEKAATKISEFTTTLIKDENEPSTKKRKLTQSNMKDLIEHPRKTNSIPYVWKGFWMRANAANEKLQCRQPGCSYNTMILNEIYDHYNECKFTPIPTFLCKICKYVSTTLASMKEHMREQHADRIKTQVDSDFSMNEASDDSDANDTPMLLSKNRKSTSGQLIKSTKFEDRAIFIRDEKHYREGNIKMTFSPALRWTLDFELKNYSLHLFEDYQPNNFILLTNNEANDYIPKLTKSMRVKQVNFGKENCENNEWKIWNRFESSVIDGFPTFFVGGPVWATAWLPIPTILYSHNVNQYIAISTHSQMNDSFIMGKSYKFKNIIQIWDLGHLEHSSSHIPTTPKLAYAIAHDKGTVWCMEWCPSGTYGNSLSTNSNSQTKNSSHRMGLLAVASSDGCVHIYSMAFPQKLNFNKTDKNNLPIYKTDPVVTLQVNNLLHELNEVNWQCMTLSWSKVYGHNTIAAGFTNGYVGLWDLTSKSPLLVTKNNATLIISSYQYFYAHKQAVTGVTIIPLKGNRYLATTSIDRNSNFWDLEEISSYVNASRKGVSVNSTWISHWPNIFSAYDDVSAVGRTTTCMIGLRESNNNNTNKTIPLLPTNSPSYGLASCDFANGICHGTSAGELVAIFPFQMLYPRDLDKLTKKRWLVSSINVVDFEIQGKDNIEKLIKLEKGKTNKKKQTSNSKEYVYMPDTYEKCNDRFGIIFHDDVNNIRSEKMKKSGGRNPLNSDTMKTVPVEQYNFASINRISWNPNAWSYLWLGIGYQSGFIRILNLKSMSMQNAIMKLLPEHARKILNTKNEMMS